MPQRVTAGLHFAKGDVKIAGLGEDDVKKWESIGVNDMLPPDSNSFLDAVDVDYSGYSGPAKLSVKFKPLKLWVIPAE